MADNRPSASSATIVYRQQSGGILGNADHTVIYGGNFTNVVRNKKGSTQDQSITGYAHRFYNQWFAKMDSSAYKNE